MTEPHSEMEKYNMHYDEIIEVKARLLQENEGGELYIHDPDREAENDAIYEVMSKYYPEVYGDELESEEERALWNDAQVKHIMHFVDLATAEVKRLREEKEAMLKHITDLEASLTELNNDWLAGNDMDEAFTEHFKKFSYLRAQSKAVHDAQQDDGYEPPEHMTADDFNEMHSGPYQPDDSGYMDGDE